MAAILDYKLVAIALSIGKKADFDTLAEAHEPILMKLGMMDNVQDLTLLLW